MRMTCEASCALGADASHVASTGRSPGVFGPPMWRVLHTSAALYPSSPEPKRIAECASFVRGLPSIIPCDGCAKNLRSELAGRDEFLACASGESLSQMWCEVHNAVNVRTSKPLVDCSQVQDMYAMPLLPSAALGTEDRELHAVKSCVEFG